MLILMMLIGLARGETCAVQTKAYEECGIPWPPEMYDEAFLRVSDDPGEHGPQLQKFAKLFNLAAAKLVRCDRISRSTREECGGSHLMAKANRVGAQNTLRLQEWQGNLLGAMQAVERAGDSGVGTNCILTPREGTPVLRCYALDKSRPHARVVTDADAETLDVTVGMSTNCTFAALPDGRLLTADHCGRQSITRGALLRQKGAVPVVAEFIDSLVASSLQLFTGSSFEDLAVWRGADTARGRPIYLLTQDVSRDEGCEIEDDLYLACAPSVYRGLNGKRAHVLGFPMLRYRDRVRVETVILSEGDVIYDKDTERILVHAGVSPGSSGGPVYLKPGDTMGGVTLDRPLYLGPVSTVAWAKQIKSEFATDSLVVVGVYDLSHVRGILPP